MPNNKSTPTENVLTLYDALRHGKRVGQAEWCARLGVSVKTFDRYIRTLRDHLHEKNLATGQEQSISYDPETDSYRIEGKKNTWLTDSELIAICKILIAVRAFGKEELTSLLSRLLTIVVSTAGKEEIQGLMKNELHLYESPVHEAMDGTIFLTLVSAVRARHVVQLTYKKPEAEGLSAYRVKAWAVLFDQSYFYFIGGTDKGERAFRLDRIFEAKDTGEVFAETYQGRFQPGMYRKQAPLMFNGEKEHVAFLCTPEVAEPLLERLPGAKVSYPGGHPRVDVDVEGEEGILMLLLAQGSKVKILSPESLVKRWRKEAQAIVDMAGKEP